jgi:hypothetical protein
MSDEFYDFIDDWGGYMGRSEEFKLLDEVKRAVEARAIKEFKYYIENDELIVRIRVEPTEEENPVGKLDISVPCKLRIVRIPR